MPYCDMALRSAPRGRCAIEGRVTEWEELSAALETSAQIEFTSFRSAQNQSQLAEVMIIKCLLGLGRIF